MPRERLGLWIWFGRWRSSGGVKGPRPGALYLFLGRSQSPLPGFFRHRWGRGVAGGPHHHDPSRHRGTASGSSVSVSESDPSRHLGTASGSSVSVSESAREGGCRASLSRSEFERGRHSPSPLADENTGRRGHAAARPARGANDRSCARSRDPLRPPIGGRGGASLALVRAQLDGTRLASPSRISSYLRQPFNPNPGPF